MNAPTLLAGVTIGTLIVGDRIEHLSFTATWGPLSAHAHRVSVWCRVVSVVLAWVTIASLLLR